MSMSFGSKLQLEQGSWAEALYDFYIGIVVGTRHSVYLSSRVMVEFVIQPLLYIFGVTLKNKEDDSSDSDGLKVIAVGYGRTGTVSCQAVLRVVGTARSHHGGYEEASAAGAFVAVQRTEFC